MRKQFKSGLGMLLAGILILCCLAGCSRELSEQKSSETKSDGSYRIYYLTPEKNSLVTHSYYPKSTDFEGIKEEILEAFKSSDSTDVVSALPEGVQINSAVTGINEIDVDFSAEYLSLDAISELLLRGALVRTLLQLPGVDTIRFTVDSQALKIADEEVGPMSEDTFIVPTEDSINSYRNAHLTLYLPPETGKLLKRKVRTVYYSTNVNTERLVIEEMLKKPEESGVLPVAVEGTLVSDLSVNDGICTVDFSEEINNAPPSENVTDPETILYAFTNSLIDSCEKDHITGVRFKVGGSSEGRFRNQVNLDQIFYRNAELIEGGMEETQSEPAEGSNQETQAAGEAAQEVLAAAEQAPAVEEASQEVPAAEQAPAAEEASQEAPAAEQAPAAEA